jgi:dipeptidyl aminopeptidase/acylaminoacyl peptidase
MLDAKAAKFLKKKETNMLNKKSYNSSPSFDLSPEDRGEIFINQSQTQQQQKYLSSVSEFKINPSSMLMSRAQSTPI